MADFTDGYLHGYQYLMHVYDGTIKTQSSDLGPFTGVKYRKLDSQPQKTDWQQDGSGALAKTQYFEIWSITLDGGAYQPVPGDLFIDKDEQQWNVIDCNNEQLRSSGGISPILRVSCWQPQ